MYQHQYIQHHLDKKDKNYFQLYFFFQLAEHLNKTVQEIFELNEAEIQGWVAYFKIKERREKLKR